MFEVIGVKFKGTNKVYSFNPNGIQFDEGDGVIVETSRGVEFGTVHTTNKIVESSEVVAPLKDIIRKATPEDRAQLDIIEKKRKESLKQATEIIDNHKLIMKLVDVEYAFDLKKATFFYTADGRIDFRELVKDLASRLRVRIEMRQIYERDDIKMRGALAACGRPCCCTLFLPEYEKVSLKMAKIQGLSLNPTKINGVCGKLMCCLRYENDHYQKTSKIMPPLNSVVTTPDGDGAVVGHDMIREKCKVRVVIDEIVNYKDYFLTELLVNGKQCGGACGCNKQCGKNNAIDESDDMNDDGILLEGENGES